MTNSDIKKAGLKVTQPRTKILEVFETSEKHHLTAEDIYQILSQQKIDIGLATVYRVLTQFEQAGLVIRHNFEEGHAVYELDDGEHHDHLICIKCGKVLEFVDEIIEARQKEIARQHNFKMTDHTLNIYGYCKNCQE